jgi:dsRNA-specific ribonuclease
VFDFAVVKVERSDKKKNWVMHVYNSGGHTQYEGKDFFKKNARDLTSIVDGLFYTFHDHNIY